MKKLKKEKNKIKVKYLWLMIIAQTVLIVLFSFLTYFLTTLIEPGEHKTIYNLSDLNEEEQEHIKTILNDVKPIYLSSQKSITVTYRFTEYYLKNGGDRADASSVIGFNTHLGEIYVQYFPDNYTMKRLLCHEILHTSVSGVYEEEMVEDLSKEMVCYKSERENEP